MQRYFDLYRTDIQMLNNPLETPKKRVLDMLDEQLKEVALGVKSKEELCLLTQEINEVGLSMWAIVGSYVRLAQLYHEGENEEEQLS